MGEIKPDRFYEALEVQNGRLLAEIARLQAERDALRRTVEGYNGLGHWRCRQAVELHCPDCLSPAPHHSSGCRILAALTTSSPSASGPS
jgi:hypothetical protein